jgi:hypothetical protein
MDLLFAPHVSARSRVPRFCTRLRGRAQTNGMRFRCVRLEVSSAAPLAVPCVLGLIVGAA